MRPSDTCAVPRPQGQRNAPEDAELLPAEFSALLGQIGSPDGFSDGFAARLTAGEIHAGKGLRDFLAGYQTQLLEPLEMPAICRARSHAALGHARELIALDRELAVKQVWPPFAAASRRIGRAQLERLRPLRDERTVQRYLAAVEAGRAAGWHTVVYGVALAVYSWPLRHGLLIYARETLSGLARAAGGLQGVAGSPSADGEDAAVRKILQSLLPRLPAAIERTLVETGEMSGGEGRIGEGAIHHVR
jgi:urease accessory protein UreF